MEIPKSVQDAVKRANDAREANYGNPAEAAPIEPAPTEAGHQAATAIPGGETDGGAAPAPAAQKPDTSQQQSADKQKDALYWRNRFEVVQGKYNAEVPALQRQVKELNAEIETLKASNADGGSVVDQLNGLTEKEIEEFGPDLVAFVQRLVKSTSAPKSDVDERLAAIEAERQQERESKQEEAKATFWAELEAAHPDFAAINDNVEFHKFLATPAADGRQQQAHLREAQQRLEFRRVINIFDAFKESLAAPKSREIPGEHVDAPHARGSGVDDALAADAPSFTRAEVSRYYTDAAKGKYSDAEKLAMEAKIFEAQRANRIY